MICETCGQEIPDYGMGGAGNWIAIVGPQGSQECFGPFKNDEEAIAWAIKNNDPDGWQVVNLTNPNQDEES